MPEEFTPRAALVIEDEPLIQGAWVYRVLNNPFDIADVQNIVAAVQPSRGT